jgi:catechol 2,3-dioxygenase-like lactoylglutathione lyase family enzyme
MPLHTPLPILQKLDCIRIRVDSLETGLVFYRDKLGLPLRWRMGKSAGVGLPGTETELVLTEEEIPLEVDLLVDSAEMAAGWFTQNGGNVIAGPFETPIGTGYLVADPWNNRFVLLDARKGLLKTDPDGLVIGHQAV